MPGAMQVNHVSAGAPARYRPPREFPLALARPRLTERFHAFVGSGLTVVQAPAGYGKTVAIASFLEGLDFDARWLSLDPSSTTAEVFAAQLAAAVLGDDAWAPPSASRPEDLRAYLNAAMDRREQTATQPLLLAVDNAHVIREAYQCCELLDWLIETLPFAAEVVISGREPLPLPEVDRRVLGGQCLLLGAVDLAFTPGEVAALCERSGSGERAAEILDATAGWPIAVTGVLAGAVSPTTTREAIAGGSWDRYLFTEVWQSIPSEICQALIAISPVTVVENWLAETLLGEDRWRLLRRWLTERDFLCERLHDGGVRLNPQFVAFLRERLIDTGEQPAESIVRAAVVALEGRSQVAAAIETAIDHPPVLADVLLRHHGDLLRQAAFNLLWRGYSHLSQDLIDGNELLAATYIRVMAHAGFPDRALELSADFLENRQASGTARYHVLLGRIRALRLLARVTELTELFSQAKEAVGTADESLVAEFAWQEAEAVLAVEADFAKVERLLQQVLNLARSSDHRTLELLASSTYGHLLVMRGEGPRAVNELAKAARGWRTMRGTANLGWVLNNLGMAHLLVGDFSSALRVLREAKAEAARCQNRRTEAFAIASLGDTELALGRFEAARVQYEEAIRICAEEVLDESLATLSVAGLASTMLGLGDRQQADFLARHALEAAGLIGNPFELGQCALLLASVELAAGDARRAVVSAERAVELFASIDARSSLRSAHYRLAVCQFKAGDRRAAVASLTALAEELTEPWMAGALVPLAREHPIVAQWAAGRAEAPPALKLVIEQISGVPETDPPSPDQGELPIVRAHSLGEVRVWVDEHEVTDERWTSARARELFYLFLAHPHGVRKEEAVETLYPDLPPARCNSAFHSNLYRVRHALYRDSVVKQEGIYRLNDDGIFDWDVAEFEACLSRAESLPKGSDERVGLYESALKLYQGPFAEIFESEWAASLREHLAAREQRALALLAGHYAGIGRFEAAAGMLRRILERDPYDDQAAYGLARSQAMAGQASAALHFLDTYTARLQDDLGVAPRAQLVELREAIAAGRAG